MADDIIIDVKNVWKRYGLPPMLPWKKREFRESDFALKDISFQVRRGGSLGILGHNGAGKSTLLKLLAGVTPPDKGSIDIRGSIFPMIELNAGISMELTGRENIALLATIMGFNDRQIRRLEPEVIDFSELEEWIDRPVWQYSSGMLARLAFGIAVHAKADILLVDEVLSTGDIMFQKKCQRQVQKLLSGGVTLLFVSHNPYQVEKMTSHAILLDKGRCLKKGPSGEVMREYMARSAGQEKATSSDRQIDLTATMEARPGTGDIRVTDFTIIDAKGKPVSSISVGDSITFEIRYIAKEDIFPININIIIYDISGTPLSILSPERKEGEWISVKKGRGCFQCHIENFPLIGIGLYCSTKITSTYLVDFVDIGIIFQSDIAIEKVAISNVGSIYIEGNWKNEQYI